MQKKFLLAMLACSLMMMLISGDLHAKKSHPGGNSIEPIVQILSKKFNTSISLDSYKKEHIFGNIFHYTYMLKFNDREHKLIGIHRVIKNDRKKNKNAVVLLPNEMGNFDTFFFPSSRYDVIDEKDAAIHLAKRGIDVWGIDYPAGLLPEDTTDFSFMKEWGMVDSLHDIKVATKMIRMMRGFTGYGFGKVIMLGYGRGGQLTYAYANEETKEQNPFEKDLKGIIPMEALYKYDPAHTEQIEGVRQRYSILKDRYDNGIYYYNQAYRYKVMAEYAVNDPDGISPFISDYTNKDLMLYICAATYESYSAVWGETIPTFTPNFHYWGGYYNGPGDGDFTYSDFDYTLTVIRDQLTLYLSILESADAVAIVADIDHGLPLDDSLDKITTPTFYVGAAGGMGYYATYPVRELMTACKDKTILMVQLQSSENEKMDYGINDMTYADNRVEYVWEPVAQWILKH